MRAKGQVKLDVDMTRKQKKRAARKAKRQARTAELQIGDTLNIIADEDRIIIDGKELGNNRKYHTWVRGQVIDHEGYPLSSTPHGFI